jgi:hypothetical protein
MEVGDGKRFLILAGLKGLSLCYFPGSLGSEVWHPICKQAARAEKKLKVSKLVMNDARSEVLRDHLLPQAVGARLQYRVSNLSATTPKCEPASLDSLIRRPASWGLEAIKTLDVRAL